MNVLFFATRIIYGGGERVRNWLALNLCSSGDTVIYAIPEGNDSLINDLKKVALYDKIKIVSYPSRLKRINLYKYIKELERIYLTNKIDLLVYFGGSLIEQIVARKLGVKIILSERCDPNSRPLPSRVLKRIQYKVSDGYVFQTPAASECYGKRAQKVSRVIPNPILDQSPDPVFTNLRKEIVTVGRLSREKNQMMLLRAFYKINCSIPEYKLVIYGSGPLEEELIEYVKLKKLEDKVFIVTGKTNITELINGASLFVLPSNTEGMPNALIEAMSMGLLSISTDCPIYGPRYLVQHGVNAFLTPIDDADKLASLMLNVLDSPNADSIRQEAVKIREVLSATKIFKCWREYIRLVLNENIENEK